MKSLMDFKTKYGISLNNQQEMVVEHVDGPAVVLAVAGAGKTTSIVSRIGNLILNYGISPESIITMTFSKASAKDMKNRFIELFGNEITSHVEFSTIHSFAYKVMYMYSKSTGNTFNLIEEERENKNDLNRITKYKVLRQICLNSFNRYLSEDQLEELINTIGYVKNMMLCEEDYVQHDITFPKFKEVYNSYEQYKKQNNLIDFDDMLTITYELLLKNPKLLDRLRNKYSYIQVDEAQDTSPIQFEIIKLLAQPKNNVVFVGDDDQSIYRFRGTKPELMLNFSKHFSKSKSYFMEQNFRSTQDVIKLANAFIKENKKRYKKNIYTDKAEFLPPKIIYSDDEISQLEFIIRQLSETPNYKTNAIIYRNNQSAIYIMDFLNKHSFNFYIKDFKNKFFKHWLIQDILSFINVALNPSDINSFSNIYYKTNGYLTKNIISYTKQTLQEGPGTIFDTMLSFPSLTDLQKINIIKLKSSFNALKNSNGKDYVRIIELQLGYENFLKRQSNDNSNSMGHLKNILGILKLVTNEVNSINEVKFKLNHLELLLKNSSYASNSSNITLTTAHSSKGLEFDNVYVVDLVEDIFPNYSSLKKLKEEKLLDEFEEERRLMYVAITRAKERLFLFSLNNKNFDKADKSTFIKEIEKILQIKEEVDISYLCKNTKIEHKRFGIGSIKKIENSTAIINFPSGEKLIDLDICTENNLIKIIKS